MGQLKPAIVAGAALLAAACTVHQSEAPSLSGPSGTGLSLHVTATPDTLILNGSQASVAVDARDATGAPVVSLPLRLDVLVNNKVADCGTLTTHNLTTGSDGRATTVFTAPTLPLPQPDCDAFVPGGSVLIEATPILNNTLSSPGLTNIAGIRMVEPTIITDPNAPTVYFTIAPSPAKVHDTVVVNASQSHAAPGRTIVSYDWDFGDGVQKSGVIQSHDYDTASVFTVTLTVTDDIGQKTIKAAALTITN